MSKDTGSSKLSLDISGGASLKSEIKTEIPSASSGRMLDAFTDMIRPFSEKRGLKADRIRLQREEVLIEVAKLANKRRLEENREIEPVPNAILVPLLEKASLAEMENISLVEMWSNLLLSAATDLRDNHAIFVDTLSKLRINHLRFLDFVRGDNLFSAPVVGDYSDFFSDNYDSLRSFGDYAPYLVLDEKRTQEFFSIFESYFDANGMRIYELEVHVRHADGQNIWARSDKGLNRVSYPEEIIEALAVIGLIKVIEVDVDREIVKLLRREEYYKNINTKLEVVSFTKFGSEFYSACHD